MFASKTFNLVNEEEAKKRERLYEPKRCRWMKYIFIPALVGFVLLLILTNVDFSTDDDSALASITTKDATRGATMTSSSATEATSANSAEDATSTGDLEWMREDRELSSSATAAVLGLWCLETSDDSCEINCSGGNLNNVNKELAQQQKSCDSKLRVTFENSWFPSGRLSAGMLDGSFEAETLQILSTELTEIDPWAFEYDSMATLTTLVLNPVKLVLLTAKSFEGLAAIEVFQMTNSESYTNFYGAQFLQPIAGTVQQVTLRQLSSDNVYNPAPWLQGATFPALWRLDLSGNNFGDTLNAQTFGGLIAVRELVLSNSAITSLGTDTFAAVAATLELLDLRLNQLTTLGDDFWASVGSKPLQLELHSNSWSCACDNAKLIAGLQTELIAFDETPLCASPEAWVDTPITEVTLICGSSEESTSWEEATPPSESDSSSSADSSSISDTDETGEIEVDPTEPNTADAEPTDPDQTEADPVFRSLTCSVAGPAANVTISVRDRDASFAIYAADANTSVVLVVRDDMERLSMIYFRPRNYTYVDVTQDTQAARRSVCVDVRRSTVSTVIYVEHLEPNQTYTFCLVPDADSTTSPFNCRSHLLEDGAQGEDLVWLTTAAIGWFVPVVGLGAVLCLCLGGLAVYGLLRWRPGWLRGSRRLLRVGPNTPEVYLIPKSGAGGHHDDSCRHPDGQSTSPSLSLSLDLTSHDYMQYYKSLRCPRVVLNSCGQHPPSERAPCTPAHPCQPTSLQSTIRAEDLAEENEYQSIDYYEELF